MSFICTRQKLKDVVIHLEVSLRSNAGIGYSGGGVQIRVPSLPATIIDMGGYQADIGFGNGLSVWGDVVDLFDKSYMHLTGEWHTRKAALDARQIRNLSTSRPVNMIVYARGTQILVLIDGILANNFTQPNMRKTEGHICLQAERLSNQHMAIVYSGIEIWAL